MLQYKQTAIEKGAEYSSHYQWFMWAVQSRSSVDCFSGMYRRKQSYIQILIKIQIHEIQYILTTVDLNSLFQQKRWIDQFSFLCCSSDWFPDLPETPSIQREPTYHKSRPLSSQAPNWYEDSRKLYIYFPPQIEKSFVQSAHWPTKRKKTFSLIVYKCSTWSSSAYIMKLMYLGSFLGCIHIVKWAFCKLLKMKASAK